MIGILGGTFDPIHFGHLRPALEIQEHLGLDELRFIPCGLPPHRRRPEADVSHRLAMVEQAVALHPGFSVDRRELERDGPSYSVDTLESLRRELGAAVPLCLILGMDAFAGLSSWHRWQDLSSLAHLVVAHRPGSDEPAALEDRAAARRAENPADLRAAPAGRILCVPVTQLDISATAIRDRVARGGSPRFLLPEPVLTYIHRHGLYRACSTGNPG
ncbi:nicotinate-nucleotide adenylyltransferase [Ectothiorhodospira lacustris]|uniref:nicotinate-nucleotide adenylyltransferase n=1 Tax=Ectothiorhodospira lacustris TaxID=2899127 RepID=UPI001EE7DE27|nr:nicotinate-nucleotide adenylyltransferase [Ectothiorhodospira lacustris]MCG5500647.1 nicotinate-nucleotide adenylyltransferase [Ectothiorhodospira lacustris]MCG5508956.1 nicotinate-nucleotide adenylyltransferase [Ectothiorhodospira lacustris]MCG5520747.1 nicotinate-nucleotide adenylyltransferase [Ectothiorhodospira lacustris]